MSDLDETEVPEEKTNSQVENQAEENENHAEENENSNSEYEGDDGSDAETKIQTTISAPSTLCPSDYQDEKISFDPKTHIRDPMTGKVVPLIMDPRDDLDLEDFNETEKNPEDLETNSYSEQKESGGNSNFTEENFNSEEETFNSDEVFDEDFNSESVEDIDEKSTGYGEVEYFDEDFSSDEVENNSDEDGNNSDDPSLDEKLNDSQKNSQKISDELQAAIEKCENFNFEKVPGYNEIEEKWLDPNFKTMPHDQTLRPYQLECCQKIVNYFSDATENEKKSAGDKAGPAQNHAGLTEDKAGPAQNRAGLVRMFCGTGKSRILQEILYRYVVLEDPRDPSPKIFAVVFPSLVLINQFETQYMSHFRTRGREKILLKVCSEADATTSKTEIGDFLKGRPSRKIFLVTYQSLDLLLENVPQIDFALYDEAHHVTEPVIRELIFKKFAPKIKKKLYLTATPVNRRGIFMIRHDEKTDADEVDRHEILHCGKLIFNYSYLDGLRETKIMRTVEQKTAAKVERKASDQALTEIFPPVLQKFTIECVMWPESEHQPVAARTRGNRKLNKNPIAGEVLGTVGLSEGINREYYEILIETVIETGNSRVLTYHNSVHGTEQTAVKKFVDPVAVKKILVELDKKGKFKKVWHYAITAETTRDERKNILDHFARCPDDEIFIISSCRTLSEGIDIANCNAAFFVDWKTSALEMIQILGRIVRKKNTDRPASLILPIKLNRRDPVEAQLTKENPACRQILDVISSIRQEDESLYYAIMNQIYVNGRSENKKTQKLSRNFSGLGLNFRLKNYESLFNFKIEKFSGRVLVLENSEVRADAFEKKLLELEKFVLEHERRPNSGKEGEKNLADRFITYNRNYKRQTGIMNLSKNRLQFENFIKKFGNYFVTHDQKWFDTFKLLEKFIDENKKLPSDYSNDENERKLHGWVALQKSYYKNKTSVMKNEKKKQMWEKLCATYEWLFMPRDQKWYKIMDKLETFIFINKKLPNSTSTNKEEASLRKWLGKQELNYEREQFAMKNQNMRLKYESFKDKNAELFIDVEEQWNKNFIKFEQFLLINKKLPSGYSTNVDEYKIYKWMDSTRFDYKHKTKSMNDVNRIQKWENLVNNNKSLFLSNNQIWDLHFNEYYQFIVNNQRLPGGRSKDKNEKNLSYWGQVQKRNYTNNKQAMKLEVNRQKWESLLNEYEQLFYTYDEIWLQRLNELEQYIMLHKKLPSSDDKLKKWVVTQNITYNKQKHAMRDPNKRKLWDDFRKKYNDVFKS